jgi:glycerol-3-phosphate dehydrogenase
MAERSAAERGFDALQIELHRERAAVLGRYGRKVERALERCNELLGALEAGAGERAVEAYRAARRDLLSSITDLCIQREAIGLHDHSKVHEFYRIPPAR